MFFHFSAWITNINMWKHTKLCYNYFGNIGIFELTILHENYDYRKAQKWQLDYKVSCIHFWSQKKWYLLFRGFCGDVTTHENQE